MNEINFDCPILQELWDKFIANKDWTRISEEVSAILNDIEYFDIEYNTDTSTHSLSLCDKGMI